MTLDPGSWQGIEFRHLAALEAIATEGTFSAAASRMGYSQSAVSGQIATLERLVGHRLVRRIRGSRNVTLTREGERLVEHARAITAQLNAARADVDQLAGGGEGVRIGTFQSVSQTLLPEIVRTLTTAQIPVTLREDLAMEQQVEMLATGELDVAFVLLPVDDVDAIETIELVRDPWVLAVRTDHPLVWQQRPITARDVSDLPLITFEQLRPQKLIEGSLRAAGAHVRVVTRLRDYASVVAMVAAGLGCGLVPRLAVDADSGAARLAGLRFLEIEHQPPRLVGLAWKRARADDEVVQRVAELALAAVAGPSYRSPRATNGRTA